jgi:hypothetical protein
MIRQYLPNKTKVILFIGLKFFPHGLAMEKRVLELEKTADGLEFTVCGLLRVVS